MSCLVSHFMSHHTPAILHSFITHNTVYSTVSPQQSYGYSTTVQNVIKYVQHAHGHCKVRTVFFVWMYYVHWYRQYYTHIQCWNIQILLVRNDCSTVYIDTYILYIRSPKETKRHSFSRRVRTTTVVDPSMVQLTEHINASRPFILLAVVEYVVRRNHVQCNSKEIA